MYKLIIEDINGVWRVADLGEDKPAMTYQINNLAELKDRQADYSQEINLPLTPNNIHLLGFSHCPDVVTEIPYKKMNCRLYSNDYELAGIGSVIYIDSITEESFVCQILSGNANLFDEMESTLLESIDLGSTILTDSSTTSSMPTGISQFKISIGKDNNGEIMLGYWYFINLYYLINKIIEYLGYSLVTNISDSLENYFFSLNSLKKTNELTNGQNNSLIPFYCKINFGGNVKTFYIERDVRTTKRFSLSISSFTNMSLSSMSNNILAYVPNMNGKIRLRIYNVPTITYTVDEKGRTDITTREIMPYIAIKITQDDETITSDIARDDNYYPFSSPYYDIYIDVQNGQKIKVEISFGATYYYRYSTQDVTPVPELTLTALPNNVYVEIIEYSTDDDTLPIGANLYFNNNTGFDNCQDLFKAFLQTFALICKIDNVNKKVYCYSYKQLYDNIHNSKDWSKKTVLNKESTLSFDLSSYGQKNSISMKEKDDYTDKGYFEVANEVLDKNKELFSLAWESGKDISTTINNATTKIAFIPVYEWGDDGVKSFKETTPHLVVVNSTTNMPIHFTAQNIIDTFYTEIKDKLLAKAKILEIYLYLTDEDIKDFDAFTPVYIARFGLYFYVNKITNYVNSKLTKVELIKL